MKENREIERRYLLKKMPTGVRWDDILDIVQYYIDIDGITWRLRLTFSLFNEGEPQIEFLHKVFNGTGDFTEVIKEIEGNEVSKLIDQAHKVLHKIRFIHKDGDLKFEVDQISGVEFTMLEVELTDINQEFVIPEVLREHIAVEITGIKELSNASLAKKIK